MARKPGISLTVCSQPMPTPSKFAASTTKLLSSADHVAKDSGMAAAIRNSRKTGRRTKLRFSASPRSRVLLRFRNSMFNTACGRLLRPRSGIGGVNSCRKPRPDRRGNQFLA